MRIPYFLGCFLVCAAVLLMNATAAEYIDDMNGAAGNDFKSYTNLTKQSYRGAASLPDSTALTFADISKPIGSADYLAAGTETVKAAIYTHVGTRITQRPEDGQYMLGVFRQNMAEIMANSSLQALYCPKTGGIYTEAGGLKQAATDNVSYMFVPVIVPPQGEKIGYGVNIYYSPGGGQFTRAPVTGFSYNYNLTAEFCYEEYSAAVPQSAKMIKVEINDAYEVPLTNGGAINKVPRYMTAVASVTLSGSSMSLGVQEVSSETAPNTEIPTGGTVVTGGTDGTGAEAYAERKSAGAKGKDDNEEEIESEQEFVDAAKKESSSKSQSPSKFSGTITSSSKERASSSEKSSSKSAKDGVSRESSSTPNAESAAREESVIYQISRNPETSRFNGTVTVYIIVVSAAILLVIVLPRKK